jgi:hypothetical protein
MFQYQDKVNAGVPQLCTKEIWDNLIDSPEVKDICRRIAALDPTAEDYNDRKQALKRRLPIIIPHAASFKNGKRISADAIPSGLAMLDVDHVDNPKEITPLQLSPQGERALNQWGYRSTQIPPRSRGKVYPRVFVVRSSNSL